MAAPTAAAARALHLVTHCYRSTPLSRAAGASVYVKMENEQIPGSFKIRGVGHLAQRAVKEGARRLVSSSGGNAGLAAAYAGQCLDVPVTVVVPSSTPKLTHERLRSYGAEVRVHGKAWDDADKLARSLCDDGAAYVPPFDHPMLWKGNSTVVEEMQTQLPVKPDLVVVAVGGGGLLCGVLEGLHKVGWPDVPVLAVETEGAHSFKASVDAGSLQTLPAITSIAKNLGALTVAKQAMEWTTKHDIAAEVVHDLEALTACRRFLDDHRVLAEPSCGAALAAVYDPDTLKRVLVDRVDKPLAEVNIAAIVCGGSAVTMQMLDDWEAGLRA